MKAQFSQHPAPAFILGLVSMILLARLLVLGAFPLMDPTEGRYAEIGREMVTTGNWVVPQIEEEVPFWGKPPLMFWFMAASYSLMGFSEYSARFPSFFLSCFTLVMVYFLARRILNASFALMSVLFLSTMALFYSYAGYVAVDTALLFTVTLALSGMLCALISESKSGRRWWSYVFFLGLGLSLLAKGLVGAVLIMGPVILWIWWNREWRTIRSLPWFTGLILTLLVAVPWHIVCEMKSPGFLDYYIIGEHWKRFTVSDWEGDRYGSPHQFPRGTILLFFLITALPWSLVFLVTLIQRPPIREISKGLLGDRVFSFLVFWFLVPLLFFTISRNIMFTYTLPCLPAFAMLLARVFLIEAETEHQDHLTTVSSNLIGGLALIVPTIFLLAAYFVIPLLGESRSQKELAAQFMNLDFDSDAALIYTDRMPLSGDFYAGGRAIDIPDENPDTILSHLKDVDQDYFAIEVDDLESFPFEGLALTTEVGRFGDYILRREFDPSDLPLKFVLPATPEEYDPNREISTMETAPRIDPPPTNGS
ncbi:MAG: glycosyltransferase family 39 protein [Candidatus Omnitrophica bacterium]|nr:glycosyltransferase family 39 protein [Candidatus Omnitrophota bacterium]